MSEPVCFPQSVDRIGYDRPDQATSNCAYQQRAPKGLSKQALDSPGGHLLGRWLAWKLIDIQVNEQERTTESNQPDEEGTEIHSSPIGAHNRPFGLDWRGF